MTRGFFLWLALAALLAAPLGPLVGQAVPKGFQTAQAPLRGIAGLRWADRGAQIWAESGFKADAQSYVIRKGVKVPCAKGWAQFTDATWETAIKKGWVGPGADRTNVEDAVKAQHGYMLELEAYFRGIMGPVPYDLWWDGALGGYNAGPGSIKKAIWLGRQAGDPDPGGWPRYLPRVTGEHAKETLGYIPRIHRFKAVLQQKGGA